MHVSLDGYVSGPNGELSWAKVDEELFAHVGERIAKTDTALYGRVTYEMMEGYWPTAADQPNASRHDIEHSAWYKKVNKEVLSKSLTPDSKRLDVSIISDDLVDHIQQLKQGTGEEILVFGSPSATHALMEQNLIDGYWLFLNPIILGKGVRLFADGMDQSHLKLTTTQQFASGVIELGYEVER